MDKKKVTYEDLYDFEFVSDPQIAPDGGHALFVRSRADQEKNGYTSDLWIIDLTTNQVRQLTSGGDEKSPYWLDADTVVFQCHRLPGKEKEGTTWYKISIHGGEALLHRHTEKTVNRVWELADGDYLFLTTEDAAPEKAEKRDDRYVAQQGKDFEVFDEFPFWMNGRKVINKKRSHLYLHRQGEDVLLTPNLLDVGGVQLSEDKTKLVYAGTTYQDVRPITGGLYLYHLVTGETRILIPEGEAAIQSPFFMGNETVFYTSLAREKRGDNSDFYLYHLDTDTAEKLPFNDADPHGGVGTDAAFGGGRQMKYQDGYLYFVENVWSNAHLVRMDRSGQVTPVDNTPGSLTAFDMAGDMVLFAAMRGQHLGEIYRLEAGQEKQITHFNDAYYVSHAVAEPEYFTMEDRDGVVLEGFVLRPADYEEGKTYPGLLEMHGGPKGIFGSVFHHEMQCYAAKGYFVFYTNPRGSDGRGDAFAKINGLLGTIDYRDFMDFTDEVLRRYPEIDPGRLGVLGGSYGGYMTNWIIGHTDRFKAAASQRSISNYFTKELCTDIGITYDLPQAGGDPWEDYDQLWEISPLKYADQAVTPTLFIQSDEDYRCWQSGAFQMFNALQQNGTDSRIALFHGETHELSRSGKPKNRISRLKEMGDWFDRYLQEE